MQGCRWNIFAGSLCCVRESRLCVCVRKVCEKLSSSLSDASGAKNTRVMLQNVYLIGTLRYLTFFLDTHNKYSVIFFLSAMFSFFIRLILHIFENMREYLCFNNKIVFVYGLTVYLLYV